MKKGVYILLCLLLGQVSQLVAEAEMPALKIEQNKQLFADDYIIEKLQNVYRVMNQPVKYAGNPLLELNPQQKPGSDDLIVVSGTVLFDQQESLFKMWYEGANYNWDHNVLCYAYSKDGLHWELPDLGLIEYQKSKQNNIVFEKGVGEMAPAVMKDPVTQDASRRYKLLYKRAGLGWPLQGINTAYSSDGVHWERWYEEDVIEKSDSPNSVLWDAKMQKYIAHTREWEGGKKTRVVLQSESEDFINWKRKKVIMRPDEQDPPGRQFYNMEWMPYEGVNFGFLAVYDVNKGPAWDKVNIQLCYSRDGWNWSRMGERQPFIENGAEPGMVDWGQIYVMQKPIVVGDEIWIYYVGFKGLHWAIKNKELQGTSVNLCKIRSDGFVSLDAGGRGTVVTKPFVMSGDRLVVNANAAHDASVKVEILDESYQAIEGFGLKDNGVLTGDDVRHEVTWNGSSDVSSLQKKRIRLRFHLDRSKLYSFVFVAEKP
ncbi:MAG: hypothetical protein L3J39_07135 [Verrucomicrobiales bacterium]|nr:hypothetical protein [Verrucomicrobiales bacterium]